jgi:hypothetical protein
MSYIDVLHQLIRLGELDGRSFDGDMILTTPVNDSAPTMNLSTYASPDVISS